VPPVGSGRKFGNFSMVLLTLRVISRKAAVYEFVRANAQIAATLARTQFLDSGKQQILFLYGRELPNRRADRSRYQDENRIGCYV
jgi:hypothetical protein